MMLMLARQIEQVRQAVLADGWGCERPIPDPGELAGQTLLILGLGGIGLETARRAAGFGMHILATRRHTDRGKPDFVEAIYPPEALHDLLPKADWIAVCLPFTPETKDLIQDREFDLMKPGVHLLCATRGGIINTEALMRALDRGKVAGAGLDVTDPEPLPLDHSLWRYENVIITPHASGRAEAAFSRLEDLLRDNIRRFLNGSSLRNVVNFDLQY
jgi:phosphoglycerate dehydrogenase-like enzyme